MKSQLTVRFAGLLAQTGHNVTLQLSQRGRLERFKIDFDLLRVGVAQRGLARLDDVHHAPQFLPGQLVDIQAELPLVVVTHGKAVLFLLRVVVRQGDGGGGSGGRETR